MTIRVRDYPREAARASHKRKSMVGNEIIGVLKCYAYLDGLTCQEIRTGLDEKYKPETVEQHVRFLRDEGKVERSNPGKNPAKWKVADHD